MPTYFAGQDLTAAYFNAALPITNYVTTDATKNASTTFTSITGLSAAVEASTRYALDAYIAYVATATPDIKFQITVPVGATGHWTLYGLGTATAASVGDIQAIRSSMGSGNVQAIGGSDGNSSLACVPRGYLLTGATAGTLQFQFAQNVSTAVNTQVVIGSWLRLTKLG